MYVCICVYTEYYYPDVIAMHQCATCPTAQSDRVAPRRVLPVQTPPAQAMSAVRPLQPPPHSSSYLDPHVLGKTMPRV